MRLDHNNNWALKRKEAGDAGLTGLQFSQADYNGNGRVSFSEWDSNVFNPDEREGI